MGYLGEEIPKLGFGLMRLPMKNGQIDLEQTEQMVDLFLEHGFTYFDTAYGYLNGQSEAAARTALVERYPRQAFQLATKLPAWMDHVTAEEARQMFFTSLERTGAGFFDYYLLHNLGDVRTKVFDDYDIWGFLQEQKQKGLIKHLGFSFHDKAAVLDEILTLHPEIEFVQLQINYTDWESPSVQSELCYQTACRHGKPVIIMEPVKGGMLAELPPAAAAILKKADPQASAASWALRFAASLDNLITVLSGMSNLEQMRDNLAVMESFRPLSAAERQTLQEVRDILAARPAIPCTSCGYCLKSCPQGVRIPHIFSSMNRQLVFDNLQAARNGYNFETSFGGRASQCIACGQCEQVCPQHIQIIQELATAAATLE